jgi:hypothetical protein
MKKFLTTFAAVAAGFASQVSASNVPPNPAPLTGEKAESPASSMPVEGNVQLRTASGNLAEFTLRRSEDGVLMAGHSSHASHASHASHYSCTPGKTC